MKTVLRLFIAALLAAPLIASAQGLRPQYSELNPPQPVDTDGKKIEVVEFFWYGCPHCYNLEPLLENWVKKLPPDVQFRPIPAVFNERWALDASIFYTFEALGVLPKLHRPFFDSIHRDHLRTDDQAAMTEWLQKHGVEPKKFYETMKSFSVQSKTRRAAQLSVAYKIDGTPAMAVQGRYTVSADQGGSREGMLETVSFLVNLVRKGK
ncbi:MAG TPA: thiol:disulfide interchange protein DsbA/DsbL [Burkholderiales bacterium]|jgi:protein dithiol oxidoreductase (disulfide-forming)|nr:thiol:disulfide interchange protein DsbA/DsbL [Burkholderiales bacterium]